MENKTKTIFATLNKDNLLNYLDKENASIDEQKMLLFKEEFVKANLTKKTKVIYECMEKHTRPKGETLADRILYCRKPFNMIREINWGYCPWGNCAVLSMFSSHVKNCPIKMIILNKRLEEMEKEIAGKPVEKIEQIKLEYESKLAVKEIMIKKGYAVEVKLEMKIEELQRQLLQKDEVIKSKDMLIKTKEEDLNGSAKLIIRMGEDLQVKDLLIKRLEDMVEDRNKDLIQLEKDLEAIKKNQERGICSEEQHVNVFDEEEYELPLYTFEQASQILKAERIEVNQKKDVAMMEEEEEYYEFKTPLAKNIKKLEWFSNEKLAKMDRAFIKCANNLMKYDLINWELRASEERLLVGENCFTDPVSLNEDIIEVESGIVVLQLRDGEFSIVVKDGVIIYCDVPGYANRYNNYLKDGIQYHLIQRKKYLGNYGAQKPILCDILGNEFKFE